MAPSTVFDQGVENALLQNREAKGTVDFEGVVDHGCLVNRMLPLGLCIVGVYAMGEGSSKNDLLVNLRPVLKQIQDDAQGGGKNLKSQGVLIFVDVKNVKKLVMQLEGNQVSGDVKTTSLLALLPVTCKYCLKVSLPWNDSKVSWKILSKQCVAQESTKLKKVVIFDKSGAVLNEARSVNELERENGSVTLQLYHPLASNRSIEDINVQQMFILDGVLDCRVMCDPQENIAKVIDLLKMDIIQSIKSRFRALQEMEGSPMDVESGYLPRRVWFNWKDKAQVSEYLKHDEIMQEIEDREECPTFSPGKKNWNPFEKNNGWNFNSFLMSILFGLVAVIIGTVCYSIQKA
eukprot:g8036.t1